MQGPLLLFFLSHFVLWANIFAKKCKQPESVGLAQTIYHFMDASAAQEANNTAAQVLAVAHYHLLHLGSNFNFFPRISASMSFCGIYGGKDQKRNPSRIEICCDTDDRIKAPTATIIASSFGQIMLCTVYRCLHAGVNSFTFASSSCMVCSPPLYILF
jgi:hypothetical protein